MSGGVDFSDDDYVLVTAEDTGPAGAGAPGSPVTAVAAATCTTLGAHLTDDIWRKPLEKAGVEQLASAIYALNYALCQRVMMLFLTPPSSFSAPVLSVMPARDQDLSALLDSILAIPYAVLGSENFGLVCPASFATSSHRVSSSPIAPAAATTPSERTALLGGSSGWSGGLEGRAAESASGAALSPMEEVD